MTLTVSDIIKKSSETKTQTFSPKEIGPEVAELIFSFFQEISAEAQMSQGAFNQIAQSFSLVLDCVLKMDPVQLKGIMEKEPTLQPSPRIQERLERLVKKTLPETANSHRIGVIASFLNLALHDLTLSYLIEASHDTRISQDQSTKKNNLLNLFGAWRDMPDETFHDFMLDLQKSRGRVN